MTQALHRRPSAKVLPHGNIAPEVKCLWLPLDGGTGINTGATTKNGFSRMGEFAASRLVDGLVTVTSGTPLSWRAQGGLTFSTGNGRIDAIPAAGDARD